MAKEMTLKAIGNDVVQELPKGKKPEQAEIMFDLGKP